MEFRLAQVSDDEAGRRLGEVIRAAAERSGWSTDVTDGRAMGFAAATDARTPCAAVAEVSLDEGQIRVHKVTSAIDPGIAVNPDQIRAQCEGGLIMGMSAALYEEMSIRDSVLSPTIYGPYRVALLKDAPREIHVEILENGDEPTGVGEPVLGAHRGRGGQRRRPAHRAPAAGNAVAAGAGRGGGRGGRLASHHSSVFQLRASPPQLVGRGPGPASEGPVEGSRVFVTDEERHFRDADIARPEVVHGELPAAPVQDLLVRRPLPLQVPLQGPRTHSQAAGHRSTFAWPAGRSSNSTARTRSVVSALASSSESRRRNSGSKYSHMDGLDVRKGWVASCSENATSSSPAQSSNPGSETIPSDRPEGRASGRGGG